MEIQVDTDMAPVIVIGSKPNAGFPSVRPQAVITAKSAVKQGLLYRKRFGSKIIALIPWPELETHDYVREALVESRPEEVIVLGDNNGESVDFVHNVLKLTSTKVSTYSYHERNYTLICGLGIKKMSLIINMLRIRGVKFVIRKAIEDLFVGADMKWLSRSTGINGILYARKRFINAESIIVAGVGLIGGGHFDGVGEFTDKSAKSDRIFMKYWPKSARHNVYTTDETLSRVGNIPLWNGDVFFADSP